MVRIQKVLSMIMALCLITAVVLPVLAIEPVETVLITISDGERKSEYNGFWRDGELFLAAETFGEITRYTFYASEELYGYALGKKFVLINKQSAELSIPALNYQGGQVSRIEHEGENFFAVSELLPWLNVAFYVKNGILYILPDALSIWEVIPEISYEDHMFNLYREYGDDTSDVIGLSAMVVFDSVVNLRWDKLIKTNDGESLYDYKSYVATWLEMATDETLVTKSLDDGFDKIMSLNKGIDTVEEIFGIEEKKLIEQGDQLLLDMGFDAADLGKYYELTDLWTDLRETVSVVDGVTKYIDPLKPLMSYEIIAKSDLDYLAYLQYLEENIDHSTTFKMALEEANVKLDQENGAVYSTLIELGYTVSKDAFSKPLEECLEVFSDSMGTYLNIAKVFYSTVIPVTKGYEGMAKVGVVSTIEECCWDLAMELSYEEMTEENLRWMRQSYITALKASKKCYQAMQDTMDVKILGLWDVFDGEGVMDYQINRIEEAIAKLAVTAKTAENDSIDGKDEQSDYIREELAKLFVSSWECTSPIDLLGQPLSVAIDLWGDTYTSQGYSGGRLLQFANGGTVILNDTPTVWDDPISRNERIAYVMLFDGENIIGDIHANMTYSEIQQLAAKYVFEPEKPQVYAMELVETGYYISEFTYSGLHFVYSWTSPDADPDYEPADYVCINKAGKSITAIGKWYSGLYYQGNNTGEYDIFIYADVHEDGTCEIRWIEPFEQEDSTETFEYMVVQKPEDVMDEYLHIYFDEQRDQLHINVDGSLVVMDRKQQDYCFACNYEVDYLKSTHCPNCGMTFTAMKPDGYVETSGDGNDTENDAYADPNDGYSLSEAKSNQDGSLFVLKEGRFYPVETFYVVSADPYPGDEQYGAAVDQLTNVPVLCLSEGALLVTFDSVSQYQVRRVEQTRYCLPVEVTGWSDGVEFTNGYPIVQCEYHQNTKEIEGVPITDKESLSGALAVRNAYLLNLRKDGFLSFSKEYICADQKTILCGGYYDDTAWLEYDLYVDTPLYYFSNEVFLPVEETKDGYFIVDTTQLEYGDYVIETGFDIMFGDFYCMFTVN